MLQFIQQTVLLIVQNFYLLSQLPHLTLVVLQIFFPREQQLPHLHHHPLRRRQLPLRQILQPQIDRLRSHTSAHLLHPVYCLLYQRNLTLGLDHLRTSISKLSQDLFHLQLVLRLKTMSLRLHKLVPMGELGLQVGDLLLLHRQLLLVDLPQGLIFKSR